MNKLPRASRARALQLLCKGTSSLVTSRRTGLSMTAILRLLAISGRAAASYQDRVFRDLKSSKINITALWGFRDRNVPGAKKARGRPGNVWVWVAIDQRTKLVASWFLARRDTGSALIIIDDIVARLTKRVQLRSHRQRLSLEAVNGPLAANLDYDLVAKIYGESSEPEEPYGFALGIGGQKRPILINPTTKPISTAAVSSGMQTRLSLPKASTFEKRLANHANALALHFLYYNFVRVGKGIRSTPAMAAGITSRRWKITDIVGVLEAWEASGEC